VTYGQQQEQQKKKQMPSSTAPALNTSGCVAQAVGSGSGAMVTAVVAVIGRPLPTISEATTTTTTTAFTNVSSTNTSPEKCSYGNGLDDRIEMDPPTSDVSCAYPSNVSCPPHPIPNTWKKQQQSLLSKHSPMTLLTPMQTPSMLQQKQSLQQQQMDSKAKPSILKKKAPNANDQSSKRERKAAKTLAIITGAFVVCWMPFFVIAVLLPICADECAISPVIISLFLWLGYFNSTLNPILYTIFNQDFRNAFKRILCGRRNSVRRRNRRGVGGNGAGGRESR
jgi:5-hydroxytryptamine receptor 1